MIGHSTLLCSISLLSGLWNIAQGGDPLQADVNHSGRCYGLEWPILFTIWVRKLPFSKGFFHMFILGSCYCTLIGCSPKWTVLPKMNNCCYCHPIGRSPKRPEHLPEWFTSAYRGSPPCAIFRHPDKKEILHSYVLLELHQNYDILQLCLDRTSKTERVFVKTWLPMHKLPMHNEPRLKLIRAINRRDPKFSMVWT